MERYLAYEKTNSDDLNLIKATDLRLGLPGSDDEPEGQKRNNNKRASPEKTEESRSTGNSFFVSNANSDRDTTPPARSQAVGWPPIRSYRRNCLEGKKKEADGRGKYVKVSVDGAPYLRKIDLSVYRSYPELLKALGSMFKLTIGEYSEREGYSGSENEPTYEDKDGDWMLIGDVPWDMFISNCKKLRILKGWGQKLEA